MKRFLDVVGGWPRGGGLGPESTMRIADIASQAEIDAYVDDGAEAVLICRFLNAEGVVEERDFVGLWATSVQHQIDHLAGKMYFDHLSPLKRKMLITKADKQRRAK